MQVSSVQMLQQRHSFPPITRALTAADCFLLLHAHLGNSAECRRCCDVVVLLVSGSLGLPGCGCGAPDVLTGSVMDASCVRTARCSSRQHPEPRPHETREILRSRLDNGSISVVNGDVRIYFCVALEGTAPAISLEMDLSRSKDNVALLKV